MAANIPTIYLGDKRLIKVPLSYPLPARCWTPSLDPETGERRWASREWTDQERKVAASLHYKMIPASRIGL